MSAVTKLADIRRNEEFEKLVIMDDRDLAEMIRAHFESHPALPGEKAFKDGVNQALKDPDREQFWETNEKEEIASMFSKTRIRETPLKEGNQYLDFHKYDVSVLKRMPVDEQPETRNAGTVYVDRVNVELQKTIPTVEGPNGPEQGDVRVDVIAEQSDGTHRFIGTLPDNFLKNNPMNENSCKAELEIVDHSNGNLKNITARIVVDTDVMSGDIIDLENGELAALYEEQDGLNQ